MSTYQSESQRLRAELSKAVATRSRWRQQQIRDELAGLADKKAPAAPAARNNAAKRRGRPRKAKK